MKLSTQLGVNMLVHEANEVSITIPFTVLLMGLALRRWLLRAPPPGWSDQMSSPRLHLVPDGWYGWQMTPGYEGKRNVPYFSPIWVTRATPKKTGKGILAVSFLNVLYAEGVQDFQLNLRILKHEEDYLIADLLYDGSGPTGRAAIISHIEFEWIRRLCPEVWSTRPPETMSPAAQGSVSIYLDEVFRN